MVRFKDFYNDKNKQITPDEQIANRHKQNLEINKKDKEKESRQNQKVGKEKPATEYSNCEMDGTARNFGKSRDIK
jgi:hypothetical protein